MTFVQLITLLPMAASESKLIFDKPRSQFTGNDILYSSGYLILQRNNNNLVHKSKVLINFKTFTITIYPLLHAHI